MWKPLSAYRLDEDELDIESLEKARCFFVFGRGSVGWREVRGGGGGGGEGKAGERERGAE
jgi:hypothetical protein